MGKIIYKEGIKMLPYITVLGRIVPTYGLLAFIGIVVAICFGVFYFSHYAFSGQYSSIRSLLIPTSLRSKQSARISQPRSSAFSNGMLTDRSIISFSNIYLFSISFYYCGAGNEHLAPFIDSHFFSFKSV